MKSDFMEIIRESRFSLSEEGVFVFYETLDGFFHGHIRSWTELIVSGKIGRKALHSLEGAGLLEQVKKFK